jgi:hypothetical protein
MLGLITFIEPVLMVLAQLIVGVMLLIVCFIRVKGVRHVRQQSAVSNTRVRSGQVHLKRALAVSLPQAKSEQEVSSWCEFGCGGDSVRLAPISYPR